MEWYEQPAYIALGALLVVVLSQLGVLFIGSHGLLEARELQDASRRERQAKYACEAKYVDCAYVDPADDGSWHWVSLDGIHRDTVHQGCVWIDGQKYDECHPVGLVPNSK